MRNVYSMQGFTEACISHVIYVGTMGFHRNMYIVKRLKVVCIRVVNKRYHENNLILRIVVIQVFVLLFNRMFFNNIYVFVKKH